MSFISKYFDIMSEGNLLPEHFVFYTNTLVEQNKLPQLQIELERRSSFDLEEPQWDYEHKLRMANLVNLMTYKARVIATKDGEYSTIESIMYLSYMIDSFCSIARETSSTNNWKDHFKSIHPNTAIDWDTPRTITKNNKEQQQTLFDL